MRNTIIAIVIVIAVVGIFLAAIASRNSGPAFVSPNQSHDAEKPIAKKISENQEKNKHKEGKQEGQKRVILPQEEMGRSGIEVEAAGPGRLDISLILPAEIGVNWDRTAQIVPTLTGVVGEVRKNIGDTVSAGEVMAVIESRELAEAKAKYLAALSRMDLAKTNFTRFESLWRKEVVPEKQFLEMKNALEEAQIEVRSARQKLIAMGLPPEHVDSI